jgi:hypothetical protein
MHSYDVEIKNEQGHIAFISVEARNRSQAAKIVERMGYAVRSVNMVG